MVDIVKDVQIRAREFWRLMGDAWGGDINFMLNSDFWKRYFKVYDVLNLVIPYRELLKDICDALEIKKGEKILEAGSDTGNLAIAIKERGGRIIGLDFVEEGFRKNQKLLTTDYY